MPNLRAWRFPGSTRRRPSPLAPLLSIAAFCILSPVAAQDSRAPLYLLPNPGTSAQPEVSQGFSIAVDGTIAAVSTRSDHTGATQAGVVKIYDTATGALQFTLTNPTPALYDHFGYSVALSGTRVVVGAIYDDTGAGDAGSVYVYDLSSPAPALPFVTLTNPSPVPNGYFGKAVAISGNRIVVGAIQDQTGGNVYIYDLSNAAPTTPLLTLTNRGPWFYPSFGSAVAISDRRVIVGAPDNSVGGRSTGSVYVYDLASGVPGTPIITLNNPVPQEFEYFGQSVSVAGTRLVVGAPLDNTGNLNAGSAYVYDLAGSNPTVPTVWLNNPSPGRQDNFGYSVAISGSRVVVGAYWDDTGANESGSAYVYDLSTSNPTVPVATLNNPTPANDDRFGWSVAISNTRVVVSAMWDDTAATGAGITYVYELSGPTPNAPSAILNSPTPASDLFGSSVAISGARLMVGAPYDNTGAQASGSVHLYDLGGVAPMVPVVTLTNPSPDRFAYFGSALAVSGSRAVVGAYRHDTQSSDAGSAYVYDFTGANPFAPVTTLSGVLGDVEFGISVAISGTRVVAATTRASTATNAGRVYVFDLSTATPAAPVTTLNYPLPPNYFAESFRVAVAISGPRLVVGTAWDNPNAIEGGTAYVYDLAGTSPTAPVLTLTNPSPAALDRFGLTLAISGSWLVVGASGDDTGAPDAGHAYVYDLAGDNPSVPAVTLTNPSPAMLDNFGSSVGVSESHVVIGCHNDDSAAPDSGIAYVYELDRSKPLSLSPVLKLNKLNSSGGDAFGFAVGLDGMRVVVGAPYEDNTVVNRGAAYIFGLEPELHIVAVASGLVSVSWTPTNTPGFALQYTDALKSGLWLDAMGDGVPPAIFPSTNSSRFYRLFKP